MKYTSLFEQSKDHKFFDSWEVKSDDERISTNLKSLAEYIELARTRPYYSKLLDSVDMTRQYPLEKVEILNGDQAKKILPPNSDELLDSNHQGHTIFQSGGTTGYPKVVVFSATEMDQLDLPNGRGYYACGVKPEDRVANVFAGGSLYMTFLHINEMLERYGCINFPFSHQFDLDLFAQTVEKFNINAITGVGSTIFNIMEKMKANGTNFKFDKILYGGEHVIEEDKHHINQVYGATDILSIGYGTVDTWYIGYQCDQTPTGVFHLHDDQVHFEIIDPETGKNCEPGEIGQIVVTPFPRVATPIVRYLVGDRARLLTEKCSCGRTTPLFELLGRGDEAFRIGFETVTYSTVKGALEKFKHNYTRFQIKKHRVETKDQLVVNIETESPAHLNLENVIEELYSSMHALKKNIDEGSVLPPKIELFEPGEIPLNPRTGKFIKVIDLK